MGFLKALPNRFQTRPEPRSHLLIHNRVDWYVLALTEHLRRQGRSLFIFGPDEYVAWPAVRRVGGAVASSLTGESAVLHGEFLHHYRHLSVNEPSYERFCFERWFFIHAFATVNAPFWYIDSDYWLAPSFPIPQFPADKLWDTAYVTPVCSLATIRGFLDYLIGVYRSGDYRKMAESHPVDGRPHISDMYALFQYADTNPGVCHQIRRQAGSLGICNNFHHAAGHVANTVCRRVLMDLLEERYYCIDQETRELKEFHSLHFQGESKILLPLFIDEDIMAMRFQGSTIAEMYRGYLRSKKDWLRSVDGQAMLAMVRSTSRRSLLDESSR